MTAPEPTTVRASTSSITATRTNGDTTSGRGPTSAGRRPSGAEAGSPAASVVFERFALSPRAAEAVTHGEADVPPGRASAYSRSPRATPAKGSTGGTDTAMLGTTTKAEATGRST